MQLFLIRHGQSRGNLGIPGASPDPRLTETGQEQARHVAYFFRDQPIEALYAAPLSRTVQTATPLSRQKDLPIRLWADLAETDRGAWITGPASGPPNRMLTLSEIRSEWPHVVPEDGLQDETPWWESIAGESREAAYNRAARVLDRLRERYPDDDTPIAVITHGAFGSVLMSVALGCPPTNTNRFNQYNCGISLLAFTEEPTRLRYLNWVEHLPPALRTDWTW